MSNENNQNSPPLDQTKYWYVIQVMSGHENKVVDMLKQRIKSNHCESSFGDIIVPIEEVVEMRQGQKRRSQRKFFPGYVLINMELTDQTLYLVKDTPSVMHFIGGTRERPAPIHEHEANQILHRIQEGVDKPKPKVLFEAGEVVRVVEGPFTDFSGVVEEVNYEKNRLKVAVLIFGRSTPVELEFNQVEKEKA
jgi:transcription termination/antitermination protein NusG